MTRVLIVQKQYIFGNYLQYVYLLSVCITVFFLFFLCSFFCDAIEFFDE